jgi:hypothetical protein
MNHVYSFRSFKTKRITLVLFLILLFTMQLASLAQSLRRPISPNQPMWLVHIDTWNYADPQKIIDLIPQDIRPYVVMNIALSVFHDAASSRFQVAEYGYEIAKSWVRTCAQNRMWVMIQPSSGGYSQFSDANVSVYEEFFQNYPNFIGFNYAEQFWGYDDADDPLSPAWTTRMSHFANLLGLCNQYGGYLVVSWCGNKYTPSINPTGMLKRSSVFAAACRNYTENYILCEKYTTQAYKSDMESICLGAYLSGYSGQYGIRYDNSGWTDANGNNTNFTLSTGGAAHLEHVMLTGQTIIDGPEIIWQNCFRETSRAATTDGYMMRNWETFPQFDNVSVDIFRKILDGTVRIPTRQEVIDRTKFVIINDVNSGTIDAMYSSPETLFEGLYRIDGDGNYGDNKYFFKKTGRYPTIPTVYQLDDAVANSFQVKVNKSTYSTRWSSISSKQNEFNSQFSEEYTGTIYAGRHENGWVIYNPYKTATTASGNIPFKYNTCTSMDLSLSQYTSGVIKEYSDSLTVYLSNYDNVLNTSLKTDVIKINGSTSQPTFAYTDRGNHQASNVTESWSGGVFTLTIEHNGPIDITIDCSGSETGRLTSYKTASITAPGAPPVYNGSRQYEAECFDYKSIAGITTSGYSGSIRNYTGQGYLQFGTSSSASVRDYVTVSTAGTYPLFIKYSVTGSSVNTIALYVNGTQIATPGFSATSSNSNWTVLKQTISLNAGTNSIELKATAAASASVYFDNFVVGAEGTGTESVWLEAECGTTGSLWNINDDDNASNDKYVIVQAGNNGTSAPATANKQISYSFNVSEDGDYTIFGRIIAPSVNDDSFWLKMDNGSFALWSNITVSPTWRWVNYPLTYSLTPGTHTLTIGYGEDGAQLDKLWITNNNAALLDEGPDAINKCIVTGIDQENILGIDVSPNPVYKELTIMVGNPQGAVITLYNGEGKELFHQSNPSTNVIINMASYLSGIYLLRITGAHQTVVRKIVKD